MAIRTNIREYGDKLPVTIELVRGRLAIIALAEAGYASTEVDLIDVLEFVNRNLPEMWVTVSQPTKGEN